MIIPVKCFTCGNVLADKYKYYQQQVALKKESRGIQKDMIQYLTEDFMDKTVEGEVLDTLGLTKQCCRRHMLCHVDIFS
jgi:DNA-directed RNA polymerase subunit N (RpoN/RPB10)